MPEGHVPQHVSKLIDERLLAAATEDYADFLAMTDRQQPDV